MPSQIGLIFKRRYLLGSVDKNISRSTRSCPARMPPEMAEMYDTDRFGILYYASRQPSSNHLLLAATHLAQICRRATIPSAFIGGWTVRLSGGTRQTPGVDIAVSTTMEQFKQTVLKMPRYGPFPHPLYLRCKNMQFDCS
jgi:hypothetical protein